jgi:hypothetical protein
MLTSVRTHRKPRGPALIGLVCVAAAFRAGAAPEPDAADTLAREFLQPPRSAAPRVWWHWMNGNITKEGVQLDLAWMKRIGIGGFQNFDASLGTPQVVDQRLVFMTPPWKDAFAYTVQLADELGLEMAIAGSPGWSETGGPWVAPKDAMKKVVWSETEVPGGKRFRGLLPKPSGITGPFQSKRAAILNFAGGAEPPPPEFYADSAVIAYRIPAHPGALQAALTASAGKPDIAAIGRGDSAGVVALPMAAGGAWIQYELKPPQKIYGVTFGLQHIGLPRFLGGSLTLAELQASDDGVHFRKLAAIPTDRGGLAQDPGQTTLALPPTTARFFRVALSTPSGAAGVPGIDLSALGLAPQPPPTEFRVSRFMLHTAAVVDHFEDKAAFAATPGLYALSTPPAPADVVIARGDVLDISGHMSEGGRLDWSPPPGRWVVLRMGYSLTGAKNSPASPEATGLEVDKLDRDAVRTYLDRYLTQYQSASGGLLGARGVGFMVTDSWEAGTQNWTPALFDEFRRRRGYDLHAWLPVLTGQVVASAAASDGFLWDFRETLGELLAENHYGQLADSLRERGMGLYSESHENGRAFIGDGMQVKRHATVPMGAMWTQKPGVDAEQFGYDADVRESASVAHLYGQNLVAAESFTAGSGAWAWSPETLKPTADKEMAMGLNRFVIHTSVHQPLIGKAPGLGLGPFGQWFTRNETWAEQAAPWIRYLARSSYLLQQGRFVADVAYFYGEDSNVTALFAGKAPPVPAGYNFDFINADTVLTALSVDHGALAAPSGMHYRVLALDANAQHMSLPVLKRLAGLVADGATIVGARPSDTPSLADDSREFAELATQVWGEVGGRHGFGKGQTISGESLDVALPELGITPDIDYAGRDAKPGLLFVHRALADGDLYYIDSRKAQPQRVEVSFRVTGKAPELWHADSGEREAASYRIVDGRTLVPLELDPYETVFVVFRRPGSGPDLRVPAHAETSLASVTGPWQLQFQEGRGAPAAAQRATLGSWSESSDPGIKYFSGTATYTTTVKAGAGWLSRGTRLWLDLGEVKNIADVTLNGQDLGILWKPPFRVDMTDALKRGNNLLQIKVTNLWVNRLIGDRQPNTAQKFTFTTQAFYKADSPLLPSGLLGPVRIVQRR